MLSYNSVTSFVISFNFMFILECNFVYDFLRVLIAQKKRGKIVKQKRGLVYCDLKRRQAIVRDSYTE